MDTQDPGNLIEPDFTHLCEVHGFVYRGYKPGVKSLWRYHLHAHGLGPDPTKAVTVWDKAPGLGV